MPPVHLHTRMRLRRHEGRLRLRAGLPLRQMRLPAEEGLTGGRALGQPRAQPQGVMAGAAGFTLILLPAEAGPQALLTR
jgi:hypothetical protein